MLLCQKMNDLLEDIEAMRRAGYDPSTIELYDSYNNLIQRFLDSPIGDYVRSIEGQENRMVAGGGLLGSSSIKREITEFNPGSFLFPRGYLPIWSCDGNLIVYGLEQNRFFWGSLDSWFPDCDLIVIPETGEALPFLEENVSRALVLLSADPPSAFISDLLAGTYNERLRELG